MKPTTILWLALRGGRSDYLRISLTVVASAIASFLLLAAVNVVLIGGDKSDRYSSPLLDEPGLHQGVVISIAGLLVPLTLFVGQCSRIGAPARDRRLAGFRMAGAEPTDVARIAAVETGISASAGAATGAALFAATRRALGSELELGAVRSLPTEVSVPVWMAVVVVIAVGGTATAGATFALRKVTIDPLGVIRRKRTTPPAITPLILLVVGSAGLMFSTAVFEYLGVDRGGKIAPIAIAFLMFMCLALGLTLGAAALAHRVAAKFAPRTRLPAVLIASRRTLDNPFQASKPTAAVLLTVCTAAAIQQTRVTFLLATDPEDTFYASTFRLLNLVLAAGIVIAAAGLITATAEAIIHRRRTLATLVASGTPRSILARSALIENLFALIPGTLVATVAGVAVARGFFGTRVSPHVPGLATGEAPPVFVPVPWTDLAILTAGTIVAVTTVAALALVFIPSSTATAELRTAA